MKYVMMETDDGQLIPVLFPDCLVHATVASVIARAILVDTKRDARARSAGFVSIGDGITTQGGSESLHLESRPIDAAYIRFGDAASRMPEEFVTMMA